MGPRISLRGSDLLGVAPRSIERALQWGRGLVSAEVLPINVEANAGDERLQWGRGLVSAEVRTDFLAYSNYPLSLQWGRGLVSAEVEHLDDFFWLQMLASMGPRISLRGSSAGKAPIPAELQELQWGRGLVSAEVFMKPATVVDRSPSFNGAAD